MSVGIKVAFSTFKEMVKDYIIRVGNYGVSGMVERYNLVLLQLPDCHNPTEVAYLLHTHLSMDWEDIYEMITDILLENDEE